MIPTRANFRSLLYSHFRLERTRLTRNFGLHARKPLVQNQIALTHILTRNFGLHNSEIFPKRRSFRFVRRKITHFTIQTDASRAFVASSAGLAIRPYLLYNFSCASYTFCRIWSIFEIWGFSRTSNFLLLLHNFG